MIVILRRIEDGKIVEQPISDGIVEVVIDGITFKSTSGGLRARCSLQLVVRPEAGNTVLLSHEE